MTTERDNSGTVSRNNKKTEDRHPDIRGQCVIDGRAYWLAGWRRENERGTYYSLNFTPKDGTPRAQARHATKAPKDFPDDEIPF
jgi:hypothetical protein